MKKIDEEHLVIFCRSLFIIICMALFIFSIRACRYNPEGFKCGYMSLYDIECIPKKGIIND